MAKCTCNLPEDLLKKLSRLGSKMDDVSEKVLESGGAVVLDKVKSNLQGVLSGNSTDELSNSLGLSKVLLDRNGNHNIKVGFAEPRSNGKSNAMIANIIEYGKSGQPAKPFLKPAKSQSKKACIDAMTQKLEEEIEKL
jgi:HK97 gp10 family phage protein|nr:MAG TPA: type I neck protein [Caudoviricetes sp.]